MAKVAASSAVAFLLAGRALRVAVRKQPGNSQFGPWRTDMDLSSQNAGLYEKARAARQVPFALPVSEAIYFVAYTDSAGKKLRRGCTYCIDGRDLDTRWWSIAAYNNNRLIPNLQHRYSYSKTTVRRRDDDSWTIRFSPREQCENWLPGATDKGKLKLVLRCYGPSPELVRNPGAAPLPRVVAGLRP